MTSVSLKSLDAPKPADGSLPDEDASQILLSPDIVIVSDPNGTTAEAIRQLRTRIIAQHLERGRRTLAICSTSKDAGCSFTAANLAVAFAQIGTRVLLVDGDLRNDGLDTYFTFTNPPEGLLQQLLNDRGSDHLIGHQVLENLWLVPAGGVSSDAQEVLSTTRFERLFNNSVREYDLTIIDTPPASLFADAQRIARVASYAAVVARANRTYFNDVVELTRQLQADRVTLIGTVLNQH